MAGGAASRLPRVAVSLRGLGLQSSFHGRRHRPWPPRAVAAGLGALHIPGCVRAQAKPPIAQSAAGEICRSYVRQRTGTLGALRQFSFRIAGSPARQRRATCPHVWGPRVRTSSRSRTPWELTGGIRKDGTGSGTGGAEGRLSPSRYICGLPPRLAPTNAAAITARSTASLEGHCRSDGRLFQARIKPKWL